MCKLLNKTSTSRSEVGCVKRGQSLRWMDVECRDQCAMNLWKHFVSRILILNTASYIPGIPKMKILFSRRMRSSAMTIMGTVAATCKKSTKSSESLVISIIFQVYFTWDSWTEYRTPCVPCIGYRTNYYESALCSCSLHYAI